MGLHLHLLTLPLLLLASHSSATLDPEMVGDIFGEVGSQQVQEPLTYGAPHVETRCDELRPCVEGSFFHQYWHHYSSALECYNTCKQWNFISGPVSGSTMCTMQYQPVCGIDGKTYSNKCQATSNGVGVSCQGDCPCTNTASVCSFQGNLDGDTVCKEYKFVIDETSVYVFRAPCLVDDLDVNGGIWRGETLHHGYDTYANGWGILNYNAEDHLNRDKYDGNMIHGVMEGYGNLFWKDGSLYSGQFVNNSKKGEGTLFYSNGDIFSGQWSEERKSGAGKYMFAKGGEYIGGFTDGVQDGEGTFQMTQAQEPWEFHGQYQEGQRKSGEYKMADGDSYTGEFKSTQATYEGSGKYVWACGKEYEGSFLAGKPHGNGKLVAPPGLTWSYEGHFADGKFDSDGVFRWTENNYYEGKFSHGKMTGDGSYYLEDGGLYKDGLFYPDRADTTISYEANFDGHTLKYKRPEVTKGGYKGKGK